MPSCSSMSAWSSRESWSRRARSSGLSRNGFTAAAGDAEGDGAWAHERAAASRLRAEKATRRRYRMGVRKNRRETEKPPAGAAVSRRAMLRALGGAFDEAEWLCDQVEADRRTLTEPLHGSGCGCG